MRRLVLCVAEWLSATPAMASVDALSVAKSHQGGDEIEHLELIDFEISYCNDSSTAAPGVVIVDSLPSELSYVSDDAGGSYSGGSHSVTWVLGELASFESGAIRLTVRCNTAAADQWIPNNVDIRGSAQLPGSGSDSLHIVPEPCSAAVLVVGTLAGAWIRRRTRRRP